MAMPSDGATKPSASAGGGAGCREKFNAFLCQDVPKEIAAYASEFRCQRDAPPAAAVAAAAEEVVGNVNKYDVMVYKKEGCGYCDRAKALLATFEAERNADTTSPPITSGSALGTSPEDRLALKQLLSLGLVTFPAVFLRGQYIGGTDELTALHEKGELATRLSGARQAGHVFKTGTEAWSADLQRLARPHLLEAPGAPRGEGGSCGSWVCQSKMYANVVRAMSAVDVVLFGLVFLLLEVSESMPAAKYLGLGLLYLFFFDRALFLIGGASPFSPLGTLTTYVCWTHRGNPVGIIPYKFVWLLYMIGLFQQGLDPVCPLRSSGCFTPSAARRGLLSTFIFNSSLLAVLRF